MEVNELKNLSVEARKLTIQMIGAIGKGHVGGSLSIIETLVALYFDIMNVDPSRPSWSDRDRFVLSKGHAGPGLYAVLALKGYFPRKEVLTLNQPHTHLPSHCDMNLTCGIDMTTGSLGQGLSAATGIALAGRMDGKTYTVYCMLGDGESQEGQVWEAAMYAGSQKISNLIAFTDCNKKQIDGYLDEINTLEPVENKWQSFGWYVQRIDGHDFPQILQAVRNAKAYRQGPSMIILDTVKGKGIAFAEGVHSMTVTAEQVKNAIQELEG